LGLNTAFDLTLTMACVMFAMHWVGFLQLHLSRRAEVDDSPKPTIRLRQLLKQGFQGGSAKFLSNLFLLVFLRAPVLLPVWLSIGINLDSFAFAVAVGEVVTQFGQIPVNRAYSRWCVRQPSKISDWKLAVTAALFLWLGLSVLSVVGYTLASVMNFLPPQVASEVVMVSAVAFYASIPSFRLLRYLLWAIDKQGNAIVFLSGFLLLLMAGVVAQLPSEIWFSAAALLSVLALVALGLMSKSCFRL
jgi:hypothetical protein